MTDPLPLEISVADVKRLRDAGESFVLLDVREQDEYDTASIDGSRLLPMSELGDRVSELESLTDQRIVVHCHHGGRSLNVTGALREAGFPRVQNMTGGIDAWSQQIDPTVPRY